MLKKFLMTLAMLVLVVVPVTGCNGDDDDNNNGGNGDDNTPEDVKIGMVMDLTGALSGIGSAIRDGALLAIKDANADGGINGAEIVAVVEDGKTDAAAGFEAVKKLFGVNGINAIVGPMISPALINAGSYALQNGVVMVSPSATSVEIADQDWREIGIRTAPSDILQGALMAQLAIDAGYQNVSIIVLDNTYGVGIADIVREKLEGTGANVFDTIKYDPAKLDYLTELQIIKDQNPDCVIHVGYNDDAAVMYKQADVLGLDSAQWIASEGVWADDQMDKPETAAFMAKAVIGTKPHAPEGYQPYIDFAAAYEAEYGRSVGTYNDFAYDATMLIIEAMRNVGTDDAEAIAEEIRSIAQNYEGVSGVFSLDSLGDRTDSFYEVWEVVESGGEYSYNTVDIVVGSS